MIQCKSVRFIAAQTTVVRAFSAINQKFWLDDFSLYSRSALLTPVSGQAPQAVLCISSNPFFTAASGHLVCLCSEFVQNQSFTK